jgi:hypothetical protein
MRLFHFSDDPSISVFRPRPLRVAVDRGPDREWLNGPLVWASDEAHRLLYLFPRDCPRIVIWPTPETSKADRERWFGGKTYRAIAYVEGDWLDRVRTTTVYRYLMPPETFEDIDDVGMWVSRSTVTPLGVDRLGDLPTEMEAERVELRSLPRLTPLKIIWQTTLHASGIRTRNAQDWGPPGWSHSKPGRVVVLRWQAQPAGMFKPGAAIRSPGRELQRRDFAGR